MSTSPRRRRLLWLQPAILVGSLAPVVVLFYRWLVGQLGANPVAVVLNQLGLMALIFLSASLACTPLKKISGWKWPMRLRKTLGLLAFFAALGHVVVYVAVDQNASLLRVADEIKKRPFIAVGLAAFLMLLPLALTSTKGALKRLGARRWKRLHRLAYVAAVLACIHFYMRSKADAREAVVYAGMLAVSLVVRGAAWQRRHASRDTLGSDS